ncbi:MAG: GreA/GreB family elongation factor [Candidatus Brocadiia bacterium]
MPPTVEQLAAAADRRDFDALEDLWLELLEADSVPANELEGLLARLAAGGQGPRAIDLALSLAPELLRAQRYAEALPLLRAVAPAAKGNEEVRAGLLDCYRHCHRGKPHLGACIDAAGLLNTSDLGKAVAVLEKLLSYQEGDYFYHAAGWGLGRIVGFDPLTASAVIDFERKPGHTVPLFHIEQILTPLSPHDFRVLRVADPEGLRVLAEDDPAALVRKVLEARGGRASLRALRQALAGDVVPAETWSRWWASARSRLKRDPHVDLGRGANPTLTLRTQALSYEEEMRQRFDSLRDLGRQVALLADYATHMAGDADPQAFLLPAARALAERVREGAEPGPAFEAARLLERLGLSGVTFPSPRQILEAHDDPVPLLNSLHSAEARRHAFALLQASSAAWPQTCRDILLRGPRELWDAAFAELPPTGQPPTAESLVAELLEKPKTNLALFAWLARGLLLGRWPVSAEPQRVFELLLAEGDEVARRRARRRPADGPFPDQELLAELRQSLGAGDAAYFDAILDRASEAEAGRLLFRIRQSRVLGPRLSRTLERKIVRRHPRLLAEQEPAAAGPELIYATPEAIERRRREHEHLVNVEIPANSEDIRRAAAQGDISDNADWRSAIEQQRLLTAKAAQMSEELQRARPIEPPTVRTDQVGIGSRVTIEDTASGQRSTFTLLGPWDADAEQGIMAYTAPLAQALLRHQVGDEVALEHAGEKATYRILAIENGLAHEPGR